MHDFDDAFERVVGHEGGYVNNPKDPGGETKYGITKRTYPKENIKAMTLDRAKAIYRRDFWDKARCGELPWPVSFNVFDGAVNSGIGNSVRWLQRAAGVADDGIFGPITLGACLQADPIALSALYNAHRLFFMTDLSTFKTFGKGWARRIAGNLKVTAS